MKSKKNWIKKLSITIGVLYLLYVVAGFFVLPVLVKKNIEGTVAEVLERSLTVEDVDFNPFTLTMSLEGLLLEDDQEGPLFSAGLIRVNAQVSSAFTLSARLKEFALVDAVATVKILEDGVMNFQGLLELSPGEPEVEKSEVEEEGEPVGFYIGKVAIDNFSVDFSDESLKTPMNDIVGPISFVTDELKSEVDSESPYSFVVNIGDSTKIAWDGFVTLDPLQSKGSFEIASLDLSKGLPYIQELLDVEFEGLFSGNGSYDLNYVDGAMKVLSTETTVRLDSFSLTDIHDEESRFAFSSVELADIELDSYAQSVKIASFSIIDHSIGVVMGEEGQLRLPKGSLLSSSYDSGENEEAEIGVDPVDTPVVEGEPKEWSVYLESFSYENGEYSLLDRSFDEPVKTSISSINIEGNKIDLNNEEVETSISLSMLVLNGSGDFELNAKGNISNQAFAGDYALEALELPNLQAYVSEYSHAIIGEGRVDFDGEFTYQPESSPTASVNLKVTELNVEDARTSKQVVGLRELAISDIRYDGESVLIESVLVDGPMAVALSDESGINLATLSKLEPEEEVEGVENTEKAENSPEEVSENEKEAAEESEPLIAIKVDRIEVTNGDFRFSDTTLDPDFSVKLDQFGVETSNVSNDVNAKASPYKVSARLDDTSTFDINGISTFLDFHKKTTAEVVLHNFDLTATVPYWRTYLGRHLNKGLLTIESNYEIENSQLASSNSIRIDQLTLGEKVESEDALGLPIGFAISLLQDASGVIQINPPVKGDLDDPSVGGIGSIVLKVMGNLIIKAVTSPFSMFGSMTGGKENLDTAIVDFGSTSLSLDTKDSLAAIANILAQRPALTLGIASSLDEDEELKLARFALTQSFANEIIEDASFVYEISGATEFELVNALELYDESSDNELIEQAYSAIEWSRFTELEHTAESREEAVEESSEKVAEVVSADVEEENKTGFFKNVKRFLKLAPKEESASVENPVVQTGASSDEIEIKNVPEEIVELSVNDKRDALWILSGYELGLGEVNELSELRIAEAKSYLIENQAIDAARILDAEIDTEEKENPVGSSFLKFVLQ